MRLHHWTFYILQNENNGSSTLKRYNCKSVLRVLLSWFEFFKAHGLQASSWTVELPAKQLSRCMSIRDCFTKELSQLLSTLSYMLFPSLVPCVMRPPSGSNKSIALICSSCLLFKGRVSLVFLTIFSLTFSLAFRFLTIYVWQHLNIIALEWIWWRRRLWKNAVLTDAARRLVIVSRASSLLPWTVSVSPNHL